MKKLMALALTALMSTGAVAQNYQNKPLCVVATDGYAQLMGTHQEMMAARSDKYNPESSQSVAELPMVQLLGPNGVTASNTRDVPRLSELKGGNILMILSTGSTALAFAKDGRACVLVTLLSERSPLLRRHLPLPKQAYMHFLSIQSWARFFSPTGRLLDRGQPESQPSLLTLYRRFV